MTAEQFVQIGMRAAIRDIQEYVDGNDFPVHVRGTYEQDPFVANLLERDRLKAYLMALLITSGLSEADIA